MLTPREQLAGALKKARQEAGYKTHAALAKRLNLARTTITKAESPAQSTPSNAMLAAWAEATGVRVEEFTSIMERAKSGLPDWFVPYRTAEQGATHLRFWGPAVVPGLLQTESYARSLLTSQQQTPEQIEAILTARAERQQILGRSLVTVVMDHAALTRCVGSPAVMAEQLAHLIALTESGRIRLHIVPEGENVALGGAHAIASHGASVTVNLVTTVQDITSTAPAVIDATLAAFDLVLGASLAPVASLSCVRRMEETWRAQA